MTEPVIIGNATLYLGDCLDILPGLPPVDAVITDPPFTSVTHKGARSNIYGDGYGKNHAPIDFDSFSDDELKTCFSSINCNRWLISFIDWRHALGLEQNPPKNFEFVRFGVWVKKNPMPQLTGDRPGTGWEGIAILHPPGKKEWNGGGYPAVWDFGTSRYGWFGPSNHPTEKPIPLVSKLLEQFTNHGDLVSDPFMGSGTTGVACMQMGRSFIGIEKEPKYFDIACKRIEQAQRQPDMFIEPKPAPRIEQASFFDAA